MSENVDALIKEGIKKSRAGDKAGARALLEQATEIDPNNEKAWMWLSGVVDTPDDQRVCLENVLYLNPNNENAKRGLAILDQKYPQTGSAGSEPEPSSSAGFDSTETDTGDEYDAWRSNVGGSSGSSTSPFTVEADGFDDVFGDVFGDTDDEDPFGAGSLDADSLLDKTFDSDLDLSDSPFGQDSLVEASDPFGNTYDPFDSTYDDMDSDDVFGAHSIGTGIDDFDDLGGGLFTDDSDDVESDLLFDSVPGAVDEQDPGLFFRQIPDKIKPTRLPGRTGTSVGSILVLLVLILANVGALFMLTSGT